MSLINTLNLCLEKNLTFAAYRLPETADKKIIVQKNPVSEKVNIDTNLFEKKGFLISPFVMNSDNSSYLIAPDIVITQDGEQFYSILNAFPPVEHDTNENISDLIVDKEEYLLQVEEILNEISKGSFKKAVISRTKVVEGNYRSKISHIFDLLCTSYPNAFVYIFNVAGQLWIGATPEPLICSHSNELVTVSLAGTKEYSETNLNIDAWSNKERVEQEYVTYFIENALQKFNITGYKKSGPYTKKAGNLLHLRTDFTLNLHCINGQLGDLLNELHPSSAVCGLPKYETMDFIRNLEKHNRGYYSGFLGPLNLDERIQLFVNLRCMQVMKHRLVLYVGGGITSDSVPGDEWTETEIKADTLLSIISKV